MADNQEEVLVQFSVDRIHKELYPAFSGEDSISTFILKAVKERDSFSKQDVGIGRKMHPFDFTATTLFKNYNPHHSTCIETKKESTVGLGFWPKNREEIEQEPDESKRRKMLANSQSKASKLLDPMCEISFQDVLGDVIEDYWQTGNGYMEVIRDGDTIVGLHHLPAPSCFVFIEDAKYQKHYEIGTWKEEMATGSASGVDRRFAKFGDLKDFLERNKRETEKDLVSEIIHFRRPTSLSRWYGMPDWLAAVVSIELVQCMHQHNYDFFLNRGVPEFMLFLLGKKVENKNWKALNTALQAGIGVGNTHKSVICNLTDPNMKVQLEKLAMENKGDDGFKDRKDTLALDIVSAHRVPPLLAGIQIPGKLGATNELPNALMAFQTLVIAPTQNIVKTILGNTLGNSEVNGGLRLKLEDFSFVTILDIINVAQVDTVSRMRQTVPEAQEEGRDLDQGMKE